MPHIRLFPHSRDEFPYVDALMTWLLTALRAKGGLYHLRSAKSVEHLPVGSIVLFQWSDDKIVGEAVVAKAVAKQKEKVRIESGEVVEYEAQVTFARSSIRLYAPPLPVSTLQEILKELGDSKNIEAVPRYSRLEDWQLYPRILKEVVARGGFVL
jgi:hypothetical protein